jgi:hypothetical protein
MGVTFADHYTLVAYVHDSTGANTWRNTIEIVNTTGVIPDPGASIIRAFVGWVSGMMRNDCTLFKTELRPWARGKNAFGTTDALWENVETATGHANTGTGVWGGGSAGNAVTGEIVLKMVKTNYSAGGRVGHIYLRNVANEENSMAVAGGLPSWDPAAFGSSPDATINAYTATALGAYIGPASLPRFCNVHYSAKEMTAPFATDIGTITSAGLSLNNLKRSSKK